MTTAAPSTFQRLRSMDAAEWRFRAATTIRKTLDRARTTVTAPEWNRGDLRLHGPATIAARRFLAAGDWTAAHVELARHFRTRPQRFPLHPPEAHAVAARIKGRLGAVDTAIADRLLEGRYDVLGHGNVAAGVVPDWHLDPVHDRRAPLLFWDSVPYLDPACGDHKITWELNRHQHWLSLGRAYQLTGDGRYYETFVRQLESWLHDNPPLQGTNWASMLELAFRCLSWLWALHFFADAASERDTQPWIVDLLLGIDRQLVHVERNLSRYFSPNTHLSGEALALYAVGQTLPELGDAARRASIGRDVLIDETSRQVLSDGAHAELSAHYHRYSTDFYLLALNIARITRDPAASWFEAAARRQARFLRTIADDNGRLPLLGDDDGGQLFPICRREPSDARDSLASAAILLDDESLAVSAAPEETFWFCANHDVPAFAAPDRWPSRAFDASGYCVSRNARGDHLVIDCGPHGYLNGGHAHADALAVVLTVAGRPLLVDPGTATYTMDGAIRDRFRSTAMHNTVIVNGQTQSEPRGPFHWRTTTNAHRTDWTSDAGRDYVEGRHEGYRAVTHVRRVMALHGIGWVIVDHLTGSGLREAAAMWHLDPRWDVRRRTASCVELVQADGMRSGLVSNAEVRVVHDGGLDAYAPVYGRIQQAPCLATVAVAAAPLTLVTFIAANERWLAARIEGALNSTFEIRAEAGQIMVVSTPHERMSVHVNAGVAPSLHV